MAGRWRTVAIVGVVLMLGGACSAERGSASARPRDVNAITIGSFDFSESSLLAELYAQALEAHGYPVRRTLNLGPREFVIPAMAAGLVDLVPEYAGTSAAFLKGRSLRRRGLTALEPAPAQDANAFVVDRRVADELRLQRISDLAPMARTLTFGGPPECPSRPLCLAGLAHTYGLKFKEFVTLDAGGALTRQALTTRLVDVALLFTTDPSIGDQGFVELVDDRHLQPAENVTPLIRTDALHRWGPGTADVINGVSAALTTDELRDLNAEMSTGKDRSAVTAAWLRRHRLS